MSQPTALPQAVSELLEQLGRAMHSASFSNGLNPAQWNALRYLARTNPGARTVSGFAKHHRTEKGAASQTMAALVRKKLVRQTVDLEDRRARPLELTEGGRRLLAEDPLGGVAQALAQLSAAELLGTARAVELVARSLFPQDSRELDHDDDPSG
ncbi:MarR family winged helix-turn-helix transcriptional regulator [Zavarzinia sp. CC-PAN008]|uniref:MarR family winged helix-turn-helix transcriptional regulator n=1 Tax=Zavarzinia sp. CC-PAN008 TaxID=3243332 RepID=UPI003F7464FD